MSVAVTAAEANLVGVARAALGISNSPEFLRLLLTRAPAAKKLGPTALALFQDTLARGLVLALAREGGWRAAHGGRLWERRAAPPLAFSPNILRLLQWLLRTPWTEREVPPLTLDAPLTPAEEAFVTLLLDRARGSWLEPHLAKQAALRTSALVVLAHAGALHTAKPLEAVPPLRLDVHAPFIDGLHDVFVRAWLRQEHAKPAITSTSALTSLGTLQQRVLETFLKRISPLEHHGLASWLVEVAAQWLGPGRTDADLAGGIGPQGSLRERTEAKRASGAMLRALPTLRAWDQEHRSVRFIDDDYALAQSLVRAWERLGDAGFRAAETLVAQLDALPE